VAAETHLTPYYLVVFGLSIVFSFLLTWFVRNLAMGRGWVAPPIQERDLHEIPLPRLGGVAIFLAFLISATVTFFANRYFPSLVLGSLIRTLLTVLVPATIVFLLGVYDDIFRVSPYAKFAVESVAATMLFVGGLRILDLPVLFGARQFGWTIGLPLTILWVIGITNAFNLMDGLDGLAAGSALFSTLVVFCVAVFNNAFLVSLLSIALAGAILGFLKFNFNPATIFLGDCGSLFIGFMLSALALQSAEKSPTIVAVAIPVVSFGLPILETALSVLRRLISGRPVFTADREHIHHKLLERGMSHRQVVIVLYAVSAVFALLSMFLFWPTGSTLGLVLAVLGTGIWLGVQHLGYLEFGELGRIAQRTLEQRRASVRNLAIRRVTENLKTSQDYVQVCHLLQAAFSGNDFDGFDLRVKLSSGDRNHLDLPRVLTTSGEVLDYEWGKPEHSRWRDNTPTWNLTLALVTTKNEHRGSLNLYRFRRDAAILVDINLLISEFPVVLADALDRILFTANVGVLPEAEADTGLASAEAG
jgi:UDP-GlcNAc:undecaprenyl-phosphate/decaprenyl-phosphate GlcNAc-1-phosphate transferase